MRRLCARSWMVPLLTDDYMYYVQFLNTISETNLSVKTKKKNFSNFPISEYIN